MKIGVLALQGAFAEHINMLLRLGAEPFEIRSEKDIEREFDGLIIPGGESTVQGKLLAETGMADILRQKIKNGLCVFGTCAGLILLANKVENGGGMYLDLMNITVLRNAYGRQSGSFYTESDFGGMGNVPMTFIRAPYISKVGKDVTVLARVDGKIVAAREGNMLVSAFHPELNEDTTVHKFFLDMCKTV